MFGRLQAHDTSLSRDTSASDDYHKRHGSQGTYIKGTYQPDSLHGAMIDQWKEWRNKHDIDRTHGYNDHTRREDCIVNRQIYLSLEHHSCTLGPVMVSSSTLKWLLSWEDS